MHKHILLFAVILMVGHLSYAQFKLLGDQLDGNAPNDNFGWSVAMNESGRTIAVGAPLYDDDFGQVRVYQEAGGVWTQLGGDIEGTEIGNQYGFSLAMNAAGTRIAIGGLSGISSRSGRVEIYDLIAGQWFQRGNTILGENDGDQFGFSVDMNALGNRVVVGARNNDGNGSDAGHVRVFEEQTAATSSWVQLGSDLNGEAAGDKFGTSVAINASGDIVAIGAGENDDGGNNAGHVRVFKWENNNWVQQGVDIDGQNTDENFGASLSISDDGLILAAGANLHQHGPGTGSVRVYQFSNSSWNQMGNDIRENGINEAFGTTLSLSGNGQRLAIGDQFNDNNAMSSGKVTIYDQSGGTWSLYDPNPIEGNAIFDQLGKSIAMNKEGTRVVIGANLAAGTQGYTVVYQDSLRPVSNDYFTQNQHLAIQSYPGLLAIQSDHTLHQLNINVIGMDGKIILSQATHNTQIKHELHPGMAIVEVIHSKGTFRQKVVLQ